MKKVYVNVTTRLIIEVPDNVEDDIAVSDIIQEMDYNFKSQTQGANIIETEIVDYEVNSPDK